MARRIGVPLLVLVLAASALVSALAVRDLLHRDETMPGVRVLGSDVGGLDASALAPRVRSLTAERLRAPVGLAVPGEEVRVLPSLLFTLDRESTVSRALAAGRGSLGARGRALLSPLTAPRDVPPVLVERPAARERLRALLRPFVRPPVSASVAMRGSVPVVAPSRPGTAPDLDGLLRRLAARVAGGTGAVRVRFLPAEPAVDEAAAEAAAARARLAVSAPVALRFDGRDLGALTPPQLARLLRFRARGGSLRLTLDAERLARILDPRLAPYEIRARNARFAVAGRRVRILPSRPGLALDAPRAADGIAAAATSSARTAILRLAAQQPDLTTAEARGLGIRERLTTFTTEMGPSSANRIHNVHLMAHYIDGTIVRPGETFTFNEAVGPRTEDRGFREGQMIVGSLLLPSIGGGVCQTATTLFNNAFEAGLPITERHNHSFYISHYPVGRDATVSWGGPDFGFRNDLANAILIKAAYTDETLTFSFYGTDEGRSVSSRTSARTNWKEPQLTYALDPAAPPGSVRMERGDHQPGFDITVYRTVTKGGEVLRRDGFTSRYIPVGDTAVYGPGRQIPGPYFVIPTT